jgi:hypothetical protein
MHLFFAFLLSHVCTDSTSTINKYIAQQSLTNIVEIYAGKDEYNFELHPITSFKFSNDILQSKSTLYAGAYIQYKWFALNYSTSISSKANNPDRDIKARNFGTSIIKDKWGVWGGFHNYDGFVMLSDGGKTKEVYPQLKYTGVGIESYYNMNPQRFSMRAAYNYSRKQLKSAGGLLVLLHCDYQRWNILPLAENNKVQIKETDNEKLTNICNVIPEVGYGYNWVISKKGLLATGLINLGAGYGYINDTTNRAIPNWRAGWHAQIGYNGSKWYTYFRHNGSYQNYLSSDKFLYNQQKSSTFTIGRRF